MPILVRYRRVLANIRLALTGQERIENVPTEVFNDIVKDYLGQGWQKTFEYEGFDAWIDYGRVDLQKDGRRLRCEWDNWFEGDITGPSALIRQLAEARVLPRKGQPRRARQDASD